MVHLNEGGKIEGHLIMESVEVGGKHSSTHVLGQGVENVAKKNKLSDTSPTYP